jgi:hypothetical protein
MRNLSEFYEIVIIPERGGKFTVKGHGTYARHSVLAGQTKIVFLDSFDSYDEAKAAYPQASDSHALLEPVNTFDHLDDTEGSY